MSSAAERLAAVARHLAEGPGGGIKTIVVFGAGLMGAGIVQIAAQAGYTVHMVDVNDKAINNGLDIIKKSAARIAKKIAPKNMDEFVAYVMSNIKTFTDRNKAVEGADLVIEAIIENLKIKQELFDFLDKNTKPECILASNTSSLLLSDIFEHLPEKRKAVLCGLHYFNPVPVMRLVEVIRTDQTTEETIKIVYDVNKKMGKTAVLAKDRPGFIVNRLLAAYNREAFKMVERGDATFEDIDTAMKLGAGYPMGPFELADYTGLDLNLFIAKGWIEYNKRGLVPDYLVGESKLVRSMVEQGRTGRKSGRGFYEYKDGKKVKKGN
ncbi:uncharacterized protein CcaverHIS019_0312380 [Cutaneotrichosporon cavernicola]|uniref:3-hydroxyacyl-CoA dehydrogenase n=1 Tax=Cutaneotrichosporon cavernicola TaxID=279322 RepID=A0AA48L3B1_9TREE|nr:uncharacterized protein CcaverHIS019_0312380 [Cutaneotrichosporon cavernicola]BEI91168.1 hypothetical protein CcaverHIS019_0312380 [Cutaneotrichosporon cavernicola]BEI98945.1 hypothetical protein CcaverHIS631_0312440 [Cutaneotrichosporon cavernicola]BEJ06719.1 hypothetical protein CcaverHIS641_0312410 [Cutaneotrichosporon cavernicola]